MFPIINAAITNTINDPGQGPQYFVRPAGSFVAGHSRRPGDVQGGLIIANFLRLLKWHEVTAKAQQMGASFGKVRYFEAPVPWFTKAYEAVRLWGEMSPQEKATVRIAQSSHSNRDGSPRYELVSPLDPARASTITIMVGNGADPFTSPTMTTAVVFTWYPGRLTPMMGPITPDTSLSDLPDWATVKAEGPQAIANRGYWRRY